MSGARITIREKISGEPNYLFDTVWDGFSGDWEPAPPTLFPGDFNEDFDEAFSNGVSVPANGLRSRAPLHTAILLCLMTDRRAEDGDILPDGYGDLRGWAGDAIFPDEPPLGSRLWLLDRRELTQEVADLAVIYAREALQTLLDQRAVSRFDITAEPDFEEGRLNLFVAAYHTDGRIVADMNFWLMWQAAQAVRYPLDPA